MHGNEEGPNKKPRLGDKHLFDHNILVDVLSKFDAEEICRFGLISKDWHRATLDQRLWKKIYTSYFTPFVVAPESEKNPYELFVARLLQQPVANWKAAFIALKKEDHKDFVSEWDRFLGRPSDAELRDVYEWTAPSIDESQQYEEPLGVKNGFCQLYENVYGGVAYDRSLKTRLLREPNIMFRFFSLDIPQRAVTIYAKEKCIYWANTPKYLSWLLLKFVLLDATDPANSLRHIDQLMVNDHDHFMTLEGAFPMTFDDEYDPTRGNHDFESVAFFGEVSKFLGVPDSLDLLRRARTSMLRPILNSAIDSDDDGYYSPDGYLM